MSAARIYTRPPFCRQCNDYHLTEREGEGRTSLDLPKLLETLRGCEAYFDNKADADTDSDGVHPNAEMRRLHEVRVAIHSVELVMAARGQS